MKRSKGRSARRSWLSPQPTVSGERVWYVILIGVALHVRESWTDTSIQRVDPNRIYWQRNPNAAPNEEASSRGESSTGPRPPSYASEDGVSYVVEARPRSMAPAAMTDVLTPLPTHPSERGRMGEHRSAW